MIKRLVITFVLFFSGTHSYAGKLWEQVYYDMPVEQLKEHYKITPLSKPFAGYSDYIYKTIKLQDKTFKVVFIAVFNQIKEVSLDFQNPSEPDVRLFGELAEMLSNKHGEPKSYEKGPGYYEIFTWRQNELVVMLTIRDKDISIRYTQASPKQKKSSLKRDN